MPYWCMREALERRTTWCWFTSRVAQPEQELAHLDGSQLAILLTLPAQPRAREPLGGQRERASGDPAEEGRQGRVDLVGVHPARNVEQVRDVLRASARSQRCEGRVVQTDEGPIPVFLGGEAPSAGH